MHIALRRAPVDLLSCSVPWCQCSLKDDSVSRGLVLEVSSKSVFFGDEECEEPRKPAVAPLVLRTTSARSHHNSQGSKVAEFQWLSEDVMRTQEGDLEDDFDSGALGELPDQEVQGVDVCEEKPLPPKRSSSFSDRFLKWSRRRTDAPPPVGLQQRQGGAPVAGAAAKDLSEASAPGHPLLSSSPASSSTALTAPTSRPPIFSNFRWPRRGKSWSSSQLDVVDGSGGTQVEASDPSDSTQRRSLGEAIGLLDGEGRFTYPNGDCYEGQFSRGQRHGEGTLWCKDLRPSKYHGQWIKDVRQGHGRTEWMRSGAMHEGAYAQDRMSGPGKMTLASGVCYDGEFHKDQFHGEGSIHYSDSSWYKGHWCRGQHSGFGNQGLADGTEYSGRFLEGLPHGNGSLTKPDGTVYVGQFASGRKHGNGTLKDPGGHRRFGLWNEGEFVRWLSGNSSFAL